MADSASFESGYENEIGFGDPVPAEETGETAAICSDLFQQLIDANFPDGQTQHEIHNFTGIDIAPIHDIDQVILTTKLPELTYDVSQISKLGIHKMDDRQIEQTLEQLKSMAHKNVELKGRGQYQK